MKTAHIYISTRGGSMVVEMDGQVRGELYDTCFNECGFGFGDSFDVDYEEGDDIWTIANKIYEGDIY